MNKKFTAYNLVSPHDGARTDGYLDEANVWYPADAIVDHPCNTRQITYAELDPTKYRLVDFSEPFDRRMEWWDSNTEQWRYSDLEEPYYYNCTHRIALDLSPGQYTLRKKTVPKTLADLPKRPFWRKLGADVRDQAAGTITNNFNSHYIDVYIRRGDTYAETLDGPWLPFTKEVECE